MLDYEHRYVEWIWQNISAWYLLNHLLHVWMCVLTKLETHSTLNPFSFSFNSSIYFHCYSYSIAHLSSQTHLNSLQFHAHFDIRIAKPIVVVVDVVVFNKPVLCFSFLSCFCCVCWVYNLSHSMFVILLLFCFILFFSSVFSPSTSPLHRTFLLPSSFFISTTVSHSILYVRVRLTSSEHKHTHTECFIWKSTVLHMDGFLSLFFSSALPLSPRFSSFQSTISICPLQLITKCNRNNDDDVRLFHVISLSGQSFMWLNSGLIA